MASVPPQPIAQRPHGHPVVAGAAHVISGRPLLLLLQFAVWLAGNINAPEEEPRRPLSFYRLSPRASGSRCRRPRGTRRVSPRSRRATPLRSRRTCRSRSPSRRSPGCGRRRLARPRRCGCATTSGCSTKLVVVSITPGIRIISGGSGLLPQRRVFVLVPRIGELDAERADLGAIEQGQQPREREIVGVRAFPVAPADVQPDALARNVLASRG